MAISVCQHAGCALIVACVAIFVVGDVSADTGKAQPTDTGHVAEDGVVFLPSSHLEPSVTLEEPANQRPYTVRLRRESRPVKRNGKVVSFKTTYSGNMQVGTPPEKFRVVFDTGSGHIVLPSAHCTSPACAIHKQYNESLSTTGARINIDKTRATPDENTDMVTIGFGVGTIKGNFVHEKICMGVGSEAEDGDGPQANNAIARPCVEVPFIAATEMSANPFGLFPFDGICGLGLSALALDPEFSLFNVLTHGKHIKVPHFGFFLTEGEDGDENELAVGGHNPSRLASPLKWASVPMADLGYWQVNIVAVYIDDHMLDFCKDGSCRGIVDTGSSHLGVPAPHDKEMEKMLTKRADDLMDCRIVDAPIIKIELPGFNLTLGPENYMRRLPLRNDISMGTGVTHPNYTNSTANATNGTGNVSAPRPKNENEYFTTNLMSAVPGDDNPNELSRWCRPRMMPIKLPAPIGPNMFILGEPVLHRYYTVFDWETPAIGFGLANNNRLAQGLELLRGTDGKGVLPKDIDVYLMQQKMKAQKSDGDELHLFQEGYVIVNDEPATETVGIDCYGISERAHMWPFPQQC